MKRIRQFFQYLLLAPLLKGLSRLPLGVLYALSDVLFYGLYLWPGYRKEVVRKNLEIAFPNKSPLERKQTEKEFYRHFSDLLWEMLKTGRMSQAELQRRFRVRNPELLNEFFDRGKSVIIYGGHQGNWEWIFGLGDDIKHRKMAIYKPLSNPFINRWMLEARSKFNYALVPTYETYDFIASRESEGVPYAYGFLGDQNPLPHKAKLWLPFFGKEVPVLTGAEAVAKKHDIPVIFMEIRKIKRGFYEAVFSVITDKPRQTAPFEITREYFRRLEESIRRQPSYYYWIHRRFKHARS